MTTPPGPDEPRYATGYGGARYPLPEGAPAPQQPGPPPAGTGGGYPYGQQGPAGQQGFSGQQSPPGQPYGPYGQQQYSPYGQDRADPYGLTKEPAPARPGTVVLGLVLMVLAVLPFLAFGLLFLIVPLGPDVIPPDVLDTPGLAEAGITSVNVLVGIVRSVGVAFLVLSLLYLAFVVIGFLGRNWARILVAVMTGGFAIMLLLGVVSTIAGDPLAATVLLVPVVLSVVGIILWFLPQASRWYASR